MIGRRKGFTLIELLVVIAIILVLAAILFPIFASAQKAAQRSACANNMKQLFIGMQNYASDNNDKAPMAMPVSAITNDVSRPGNKDVCWPGLILKYIKSSKLFLCPAVTDGLQKDTYMFPPTTTLEGGPILTCYAMNIRFGLGGSKATDLGTGVDHVGEVQSLSSPPQPSKTVLLIESQNRLKWTGDSKQIPAWPGISGNMVDNMGGNYAMFCDWYDSNVEGLLGIDGIRWNDFPAAPFGHTGGCHVVCADGHVKFIKAPTDFSAQKDIQGQMFKNNLTWWNAIN